MIRQRWGLCASLLWGLVLGAAPVAPAQAPEKAEPPPPVLTFDRASVRPHMRFLRLRELEGRRTGERGAEIAVRYIASMLEVMGVEPAGVGGSYFQDVPVVRRQFIPTAFVRVRGDRRTEDLALPEDILPVTTLFPTLPEPLARGSLDLVYAAYGLDLPAWSDYEGLDVRGRAVLVRSRVPTDLPDSIRDLASGQVGIGLRINAAVQRGAAAVVLVLEDSQRDLYDALVEGVLTTALPRPPRADTTLAPEVGPEIFVTTPSRARRFLPIEGLGAAPGLLDAVFEYDTRLVYDTVQARNVIGMVRGNDLTFIDSYVAVTTDYDRPSDPLAATRASRDPTDDHGASAAALLAIADAAARGEVRPPRSMLFIWHVAEEPGLLGSSYFTMNPTVPLAQIQAVLNLSTIGIDRSDSVFVMGPSIDRTGRNRRVGQVADSVNAALPSPLAFDFRFDTRSDTTNAYRRAGHLNYARRGVPVWFLTSRDFTGERRTPFGLTLISELDVGRVAELVYRIAMAVAMSPQGVR